MTWCAIRVIREGLSQADGRFLGAGIGECSSGEEKYMWRKPVCSQEWDETAVDRRREVWKRVKGGGTEKVKQVRINPADVANTILKMADKRAYVAMTLGVTGASDAFSQDCEDLPDEVREAVLAGEQPKPPVRYARAAPATQPAGTTSPEEGETITVELESTKVQKTGEKKSRDGKKMIPWTLYHVTDVEGVHYATFDVEKYNMAVSIVNGSKIATINYKKDEKYGNAILSIAPTNPLPGSK